MSSTIGNKIIHVHASSLASIIGENDYQDMIASWISLWKTVDHGQSYNAAMVQQNLNESDLDVAQTTIQKYGVSSVIKSQLEDAETKGKLCRDAADVQREIKHAKKNILDSLVQSDYTKDEIRKDLHYIESQVQQRRIHEANNQLKKIIHDIEQQQTMHASKDEALSLAKKSTLSANPNLVDHWVNVVSGSEMLDIDRIKKELYGRSDRQTQMDMKDIRDETHKLASATTVKKIAVAESSLKRVLEMYAVPSEYASFAMRAAKRAKTEASNAADTVSAVSTRTISCTFGDHQETDSLQRLADEWKTVITKDDKYHSMTLPGIGESWAWVIGGRIDGRTEDGSIVEIKNRKSRIFDDIPFYERIQLECYMRIHNSPRIYLVQHLRRKRAGVQEKVTIVERNDMLWEQTILVLLRRVSFSFEKMLMDPERKCRLLIETQKDPRNRSDLFIREWWNKDLKFVQ